MTTTTTSGVRDLLRTALLLDAGVTGVNGLAYLVAAGPLAGLLGHPAGTLRGVGAFLVAFALAVGYVGTRRPVPRAAAWTVVGANVAWVVASLAVAGAADTTAGTVWTVLQAIVVAGFAGLQTAALRG